MKSKEKLCFYFAIRYKIQRKKLYELKFYINGVQPCRFFFFFRCTGN